MTNFFLLRNYQNGGETIWWYACGIRCLKHLVRDKAYSGSFLLREYCVSYGKAWTFKNKEELREFVSKLD